MNETTVTLTTTETAYILNSLSFLFSGALVMWMAAGFAMLESGLVRGKNTASICLKNVALFAVAGIMYYLIGYNLMYVDVAKFFGKIALFYNPAQTELDLINATTDEAKAVARTALLSGGKAYSSMSDWFFQMVFVGTAASIVSGTIAERAKMWPFLIFVAVLTAVLYPIEGSWSWGGGWLKEIGFKDFAGSTVVHTCGGWAALTGAIIVGPRKDKFDSHGRVVPLPGANMPLATLGTFILWMGWFGFNGGSQLAAGSALDIAAMSIVYVNTALAPCAGLVAAMIVSEIKYKKVDLTMALNGALAGLVSITAGPDLQNPALSLLIGTVGGLLAFFAVPLLDRLKIDDVVGAIPVHLVGGIWGTLAVGLFGGAPLLSQVIGIAAVGGFMLVTSTLLWMALKYTIGIRADDKTQELGLDRAELGIEAYPEFSWR